jgi:cation transport protein ChaC
MKSIEVSKNGIARQDLQGSSLREAITRRNGANAIPSEAELDASRAACFAKLSPNQDVWIFAYGSLVWNPIFPVAEHRRARLHGFHRSFCMTSTIGRGSIGRPGLMLALESGGSVDGVALKMERLGRDEEIRLFWRREMLARSYEPVWATVLTDEGPIEALTFVADRNATNYVGHQPLRRTAEQILEATGLLGTNLDYLDSTYHALRAYGIEDPYLGNLQSFCRRMTKMAGFEKSFVPTHSLTGEST